MPTLSFINRRFKVRNVNIIKTSSINLQKSSRLMLTVQERSGIAPAFLLTK